ncbi:MAG: YHYH protein [Bdellovibrionota bacterium]|nr:YHYH protein [Bdellovibrionota bacterium]
MTKGIVINALFILSLGGVVLNSSCSSDELSSASCTLTGNTTETDVSNSYGCYQLERDTSSCQSSREAQGLSGFWLKFSCRVTLTVSGTDVIISSDGQPDYKSNYFDSSSNCYEDFSADGRSANQNSIGEQNIVMTVPMSPSTTTANAMSLGIVGVALNGVAIFSNSASPPDDIYDEVATFDKCEGHPAGTTYHYHIEAPSITNSDYAFLGVMRDGFPVYGRLDEDSSTPSLDSEGGHTGTTPDSSSSSYHYHVNLQTSGSDSAYFITSGYYAGTAGDCTGCN